jgi:hypothetical protein
MTHGNYVRVVSYRQHGGVGFKGNHVWVQPTESFQIIHVTQSVFGRTTALQSSHTNAWLYDCSIQSLGNQENFRQRPSPRCHTLRELVDMYPQMRPCREAFLLLLLLLRCNHRRYILHLAQCRGSKFLCQCMSWQRDGPFRPD